MKKNSPYAVKNMPSEAIIMLAISYIGLVGLFGLFAAVEGKMAFIFTLIMLTVVALFVTPWAVLRQDTFWEKSSMEQFMAEGINTPDGNVSAGAALVQMLVVPVASAFGILLIMLLT